MTSRRAGIKRNGKMKQNKKNDDIKTIVTEDALHQSILKKSIYLNNNNSYCDPLKWMP